LRWNALVERKAELRRLIGRRPVSSRVCYTDHVEWFGAQTAIYAGGWIQKSAPIAERLSVTFMRMLASSAFKFSVAAVCTSTRRNRTGGSLFRSRSTPSDDLPSYLRVASVTSSPCGYPRAPMSHCFRSMSLNGVQTMKAGALRKMSGFMIFSSLIHLAASFQASTSL
jgi:hypothetical protein